MRTPSSMKHGGKTMPSTIAAPTMVPGCARGCTCRDRDLPFVVVVHKLSSLKLDWLGSVQFQRKNFSSENTTRVKSKCLKCRLPRIESTPTRCSTSRQKSNLAKLFSAVNLGARTGLKHRAWRSSYSARHSVERDMSSEPCRRSTLRVCLGHGHFDPDQNLTRS